MGLPLFPATQDMPSCYPPRLFLDNLRARGWDAGPVPENVIYTFAHMELYFASAPDQYTPNHMIGSGPNTFFLVNATGGRVGVNCLPIGAPAAASQIALQAELGVRNVLSVGTAGGLQTGMAPGDVVVVSQALRDEGTSYHFLSPEAPAVPDPALTERLAGALSGQGHLFTTGPTWTIDVPFRETAEAVRHHRSQAVQTVEMEAAAIFAASAHYGVAAASALIVDGVADESGTSWNIDLAMAAARLQEIFAIAVSVLAS